jgi:acyl carrier protein
MENIEQRVRKIIAEQLGVNETEIKNESSFVTTSAPIRSTPSSW